LLLLLVVVLCPGRKVSRGGGDVEGGSEGGREGGRDGNSCKLGESRKGIAWSVELLLLLLLGGR